jgi:CBS domain containing-hemolysin-like protein
MISPEGLFWLTIISLFCTGFAAIGVKVLHEFSRHELEEYAHQRQRRDRYDHVLDHHEQAAHAAEAVQIFSMVLLIVAGGFWITVPVESGGMSVVNLVGLLFTGGILITALTLWIPWGVVRFYSAPFLYHTWRGWYFLSQLLWPVTAGVNVFAELVSRLAGRHEEEDDEEEAFEDEIRSIATAAQRDGLIDADAREMIEGIIELSDAEVAEIMTPRSEVDAVDSASSWAEVLQLSVKTGHTRLPVFDGSIDNIVGILYVKDLLPELANRPSGPHPSLKTIIRKAWFVTDSMPLDELLRAFLQTRARSHLAVVLDEYQSVAGIVTIEDVLEEIVGEIVDEWDEAIEEPIQSIDEFTFEVNGRMHLDDLNDKLGIGLPDPDDYDTLGGFVVEQLGYIPKDGEDLIWNNFKFTVSAASKRRVEKVRVERLQRESA